MDTHLLARKGIAFAQSNQRLEALSFLRQSVQSEPPHPEVWLWLAHVSPDINEYRNCVYQALKLDAYHMVARQMQEALSQIAVQQVYQQVYNTAPVAPPPPQPIPAYAQPPYSPPTPQSRRYDTNPMVAKRRRGTSTCLIIIMAMVGLGIGIGLAIALGFGGI